MRDPTDSRTLPLPLHAPFPITGLMLGPWSCGNWRTRCHAADLGHRPLWGVINSMGARRA